MNGLLTSILIDGKIDENERAMLEVFFSEFVDAKSLANFDMDKIEQLKNEITIDGICAVCPNVSIRDNMFCFTGTSSKTTRSEICTLVESLGGSFKNNVTQKTNYLVVGDNGNTCWTFSCYGRKVEQAVTLRKKGKKIIIIHENDFWDAVEDLK